MGAAISCDTMCYREQKSRDHPPWFALGLLPNNLWPEVYTSVRSNVTEGMTSMNEMCFLTIKFSHHELILMFIIVHVPYMPIYLAW